MNTTDENTNLTPETTVVTQTDSNNGGGLVVAGLLGLGAFLLFRNGTPGTPDDDTDTNHDDNPHLVISDSEIIQWVSSPAMSDAILGQAFLQQNCIEMASLITPSDRGCKLYDPAYDLGRLDQLAAAYRARNSQYFRGQWSPNFVGQIVHGKDFWNDSIIRQFNPSFSKNTLDQRIAQILNWESNEYVRSYFASLEETRAGVAYIFQHWVGTWAHSGINVRTYAANLRYYAKQSLKGQRCRDAFGHPCASSLSWISTNGTVAIAAVLVDILDLLSSWNGFSQLIEHEYAINQRNYEGREGFIYMSPEEAGFDCARTQQSVLEACLDHVEAIDWTPFLDNSYNDPE